MWEVALQGRCICKWRWLHLLVNNNRFAVGQAGREQNNLEAQRCKSVYGAHIQGHIDSRPQAQGLTPCRAAALGFTCQAPRLACSGDCSVRPRQLLCPRKPHGPPGSGGCSVRPRRRTSSARIMAISPPTPPSMSEFSWARRMR